jgi:hypothetical protein
MKEQRKGIVIDDACIGDGVIYFMDVGIPKLALTRPQVNPILLNPLQANNQFNQLKSYPLTPTDFNRVMRDPETKVVDITQVRYFKLNEKTMIAQFVVGSYKAIEDYNYEEQQFLMQILGPTKKDFKENVQMFGSLMGDKRFCFYTPEYVKAHAREGPFAYSGRLINYTEKVPTLFNAAALFTEGDLTRFYIESNTRTDQPAPEKVPDAPRTRRTIDVQDLDEKWF